MPIANIVLVKLGSQGGVEAAGHGIAFAHGTAIDGGDGTRAVTSKERDIASVSTVVGIVEFVMDPGTAGSGRRWVEVVVLGLWERRAGHSRLARKGRGRVVTVGRRSRCRCRCAVGLVRVV